MDDTTLYDIVVTERATGRKRPLKSAEPIRGRHKAEEQARTMERNSRDPNLLYAIERHRGTQTSDQEVTPESLLTHKFRAYR